ncbi:MAG: polyprenol monophosphomannose synthase [Gemmataceae bacterium]
MTLSGEELPEGAEQVRVIIPTYCEAGNLRELIDGIAESLSGKYAFEIVIVDDASPDGTEDLCRELARRYPLRLVVRSGVRGLARAILEGFRKAGGQMLVVMDGDLSHPPEALPQLIRAVQEGADFAIGSRYVRGGSTDPTWGWYRRGLSRMAAMLAWPLLRIHDPLAGYFSLRRSTLDALPPLDPIGFKIGLELMVKARNPTIREIPIHFRNRKAGTSKLNLREHLNYLVHLAKLYGWVARRCFGR